MDRGARSHTSALDAAQRSHLERPFRCLECHHAFRRVEHLTRHARSHTTERYLECSTCQKGFYRLDALKRHEKVHLDPKRSVLGKGARACLNCAASRRKCSGDARCSACERRSMDCEYPVTGKRRRNTSNSTPDETSNGSPGEHTVASRPSSTTSWPNALESPATRQGQDPPYGLGVGEAAPMNEQTMSPPSRATNRYRDHTAQNDDLFRNSLSPAQTQLPQSPMNISSLISKNQSNFGENIPPHPNSASLKHVTGFQFSNMRNSYQGATQVTDAWYQNGFSSINWLPDNWTPDFPMGDRDDGLNSYGQDPSHLIETGPGISAGDSVEQHENAAMQTQSPADRACYQRYPHQLRHQSNEGHVISSPDSQSTRSAGGHFYVDGDGARLPRVRKAPYRAESFTPAQTHQSAKPGDGFIFPEVDEPPEHLARNIKGVSQAIYGDIVRAFNQACVISTHYPAFCGNSFPSIGVLSQLIVLYMENFQPIFPFLHQATLDLSAAHWILVLALASIGSHYMGSENSDLFVVAMHEFTRRAIHTMAESDDESKPGELILIQASLLNSIGISYCGDARLAKFASVYQSRFVAFCSSEWALRLADIESDLSSASTSASSAWAIWCEEESRRRTGYCIWMLDCMSNFHFGTRSVLSLEDARVPLPCQEVLWEAESALDWQQLYQASTPNLSLHAAIQRAYIEKHLQSSMGEFSRILCVHAIFRRTQEVATYFQQPLTSWNPKAEKESISVIEKSQPIWLTDIPAYSKWRNSACDVIDILHWHANSVVGIASGMEHPTILHLHLSRVVILTPFTYITRLARCRAGLDTTSPTELASTQAYVRRWALEDQHKARLAMIHAGVLFWHVRRYSTDAFYEPGAILLATLALWAYGTFAAHTPTRKDGQSPPREEDDADALFPTLLRLDRPADDELVQLFVKRGGGMRAVITGVGNLCSPRGPVRVLIEGRKVLGELKRWGDSRKAIKTLGALIEQCQREEAAPAGYGCTFY